MNKRIPFIFMLVLALATMVGCGSSDGGQSSSESSISSEDASSESVASSENVASSDDVASSSEASSSSIESSSSISSSSQESSSSSADSSSSSFEASGEVVSVLPGTILDTEDTAEMCTARDMTQSPDTSAAQSIALNSGEDVTITDEGVYVFTGSVTDTTIIVESDDEAKVQLVLQSVSIINTDAPAIYVKNADKVFVTSVGDNRLEVSGTFVPDGETNLDAVIYSSDDLVLNGTGTLDFISAQGNGVTSKDDLKVTGGEVLITSALDSLEANDSIRICGGDITIDTAKDGLHSENDEDPSLGYIFIADGSMTITAADDAIRATSIAQVDGGSIDVITSYEGIEATYIQLNGGTIDVYSSDDGIAAANKSSAYPVTIEVNGGTISVEVGSGDTDAFDSNGDLYINDGVINVTAPTSSFDYDGTGQLNGGTVTINGEVVTTLPTGMGFGGGGGGGFGG